MTKYREILKLHSQGISNRNIAETLECSRNTVRKVLERAKAGGVSWPLPDNASDKFLEPGRTGQSPTRSPHRPGRAQLRHPVPLVEVSHNNTRGLLSLHRYPDS